MRFALFEVGLGTSGLPGRYGKRNFQNLVETMLDKGITFIDTAPMYGKNEELLGAFSRLDEFRVCTKLGLELKVPFGSSPAGSTLNNLLRPYFFSQPERLVFSQGERARIKELFLRSLMRLRQEKIDTFLYHAASSDKELASVRDFLLELRDEGLVNRVGFSADTQFETDTSWCDAIQVPMRGLYWFHGNFDLIVNRIFAEQSGELSPVFSLDHSKRLVTLLIGTTKIEHLLEFKDRVDLLNK